MVVPLGLWVGQSIRATATPAANPPIPRGIHGSADRRLMSAAVRLGDADNCLMLVEERRSARSKVRVIFRVMVTEIGVQPNWPQEV